MSIDTNQNLDELRSQVAELNKRLVRDKKALRYRTGEVVLSCVNPFWKCVLIPYKLYQFRAQYRCEKDLPATSWSSDLDAESCIARQKELEDQLSFYNQIRWSDLHYRVGYETLLALESPVSFIKAPFRLLSLAMEQHTKKRKAIKKARKKEKLKDANANKKKWNANDRSCLFHQKISIFPKSVPANAKLEGSTLQNVSPLTNGPESILFIATNGAGLGHLTRCLAVARRIKRKCPDLEIVFLTTSLALTIVHREGFAAWSIPSRMLVDYMTPTQWNRIFQNQMTELMQLYSFDTVIFDGAMPYASISATMADAANTVKIWIKRGSEKGGAITEKRNQAESQFDYIIVPGEPGVNSEAQEDRKIYVNPIIYLDKTELWSREDVRTYLKIPAEKKAVYVQLGAGNINDIHSELGMVINELRKHPEVVIVLGESMIGDEFRIIAEDILIIKDYPNAKYFNGFDFAVSACGYNTFCELVAFGVPTLFVPNMDTKTDDQYARAMLAQNAGAGIVVTDLSSSELHTAINQLCDDDINKEMRKNALLFDLGDGADEAANAILKIREEKCPQQPMEAV